MNIKNKIDKNCIDLNLKSTNKEDLLKELIEVLYKNGIVYDKEGFFKDVCMREEIGPTSIGNNIAIPHGKSPYVKKLCVAIGKVDNGVKWNDINNSIVSFIILFAVPESENSKVEMKLMSEICIKLADDSICEKLIYSKTKEDIVEILS